MSASQARLDVAIEALQRIAAEAAYLEEAGGDGAVVGAWAREALAKVSTAPPPSNVPSSQWMEAIARAAVERTGAVMSRRVPPKVADLIVEHALKTPPPAGPGGPNDGG